MSSRLAHAHDWSKRRTKANIDDEISEEDSSAMTTDRATKSFALKLKQKRFASLKGETAGDKRALPRMLRAYGVRTSAAVVPAASGERTSFARCARQFHWGMARPAVSDMPNASCFVH